jgi:hypothetical protein
LEVVGLYGLAPLGIAVVLGIQAVWLARGLTARSRWIVLVVALAAFSALSIEIADHVARDRLMLRRAEASIFGDPTHVVTALERLGRNPLCRTSCRQGICDLVLSDSSEPVRSAAAKVLADEPQRACGTSPK